MWLINSCSMVVHASQEVERCGFERLRRIVRRRPAHKSQISGAGVQLNIGTVSFSIRQFRIPTSFLPEACSCMVLLALRASEV